MTTNRRSVRPSSIIGAIGLMLQFAGPAAAAPWHGARIGSQLKELISVRLDKAHVTRLAQGRGMAVWEDTRGETVLPLIIEPRQGVTVHGIDAQAVKDLGGYVDATSRDFMRALVPLDRVNALAAHPDIGVIRTPTVAHEADMGPMVSEGVARMNASSFYDIGVDGSGARVAVVDLGFIGLASRIAEGELPADTVGVDFSGFGTEARTVHGTGVAEHVADVAPGAQIFAIHVGDEVDLQNAADFCRANDIHVANHSVAWVLSSYYDGTGPVSDIINRSRFDDGVMWTVASGNQAQMHWRGGFTDDSGDDLHEWNGALQEMEVFPQSSQGYGTLYMNWNQYGDAVTDLDLFVMRDDGAAGWQLVGRGGARQTGRGSEPIEVATWFVEPGKRYAVSVMHMGGPIPPDFEFTIFGFDVYLSMYVVASSVVDPAAAPGAFTVGAVNHGQFPLGNPRPEPFSSQGPTTDGRLKPDIAGPDGTTSASYGVRSSYGTSFAAPSVAGAAALLFSQNPARGATDVEDTLRAMATDVGEAGPDNVFGAGLAHLVAEPNTPPNAVADTANADEDGSLVIAPLANDSDADGDALALMSVQGMQLGNALMVAGNGIFYRPFPNANGVDVFTYTIRDLRGARATGTITVTIAPSPDPPMAVDDEVLTTVDVDRSIDVLANDLDPDGDAISIVEFTQPVNGSVFAAGGGILAYTPAEGFEGADSFGYTITDGTGFDDGVVRVTVGPAPPVNCADDQAGPVVTVGRPVVTIRGRRGQRTMRYLLRDLCQMDWADDCDENPRLLHGINELTTDDPDEVIGGPQGAWQSNGITTTWHEILLNENLDEIGPRTYSFRYAVIDRANNWSFATCEVRVAGELDGCNGVDDDGDGAIDEDFASEVTECGVGACVATGATACVDGAIVDDCSPTEPTAERCGTGIDENCDGAIDEGFDEGDLCTAGVGACIRDGIMRCTVDGLGTECSAFPGSPTEELCGTELDEDCDGEVDEGFDVGAVCSVGIGACGVDGVLVCAADRRGTECDAMPGAPGVERCGTGEDEDCDGMVDEGFELVGGSCTVGEGACAADGVFACAADGLGVVCDTPPGAGGVELCGTGVDEDCDGAIDEGFDVGAVCRVGVGACAREGVAICSADGLSTECDAASGEPSGELCGTGIDEDCDGAVDEGFDVGAACSVGAGVCARSGRQICGVDGTDTTCDAIAGEPSDEICGTEADEDCDGEIDEPDCVPDAGCDPDAMGPRVTVGQPVVTIVGHHGPRVRRYSIRGLCEMDWRDNCDDPAVMIHGLNDITTDHPTERLGGPQGAWRGEGITTTWHEIFLNENLEVIGPRTYSLRYAVLDRSRNWSFVECAIRVVADAVDVCNGIDDDDGQIDEDFAPEATSCGVGACAVAGATACVDGQIIDECVPGRPSGELCGNGVDDDCNGTIDDGFDDVGLACSVGAGACRVDGQIACTADGTGTECDAVAAAPGVELCGTGEDEDCDGAIDEGFDVGASCTVGEGACAVDGFAVCAADGLGTICEADDPSAGRELCGNGIDDDCDGQIDEGFEDLGLACVVGVGACVSAGTTVCAADGVGTTCDALPGDPGTELCDTGVDEDCDGEIDEGFDVGDVCTAGVGACVTDGALVCTADGTDTECDAAPAPPGDELCANGEDDDCDGEIDEADCIGAVSCDPDVTGPVVRVDQPVVTFELAGHYVPNRTRLAEACQITWADACFDNGFLSGIVDIQVDDPSGREAIGGAPGLFQSQGILADWHDFLLDLNRNQIGPRTYTITFVVLDRLRNSTEVQCVVDVIDPRANP